MKATILRTPGENMQEPIGKIDFQVCLSTEGCSKVGRGSQNQRNAMESGITADE